MAELREYRIVAVDMHQRYKETTGATQDFNQLITEGWHLEQVITWDAAKGGAMLFSRVRPAEYELPPPPPPPGRAVAGGARPHLQGDPFGR